MSETYWAGEECLKFRKKWQRSLCLFGRLDELLQLYFTFISKDAASVIIHSKHLIDHASTDEFDLAMKWAWVTVKELDKICEERGMKEKCEKMKAEAEKEPPL